MDWIATMGFYSKSYRKSTTRADYARAAVFEEFRARDARAIEQDGFVDRPPGNWPQRLDHVAAQVAEDLGQAALRHWLSEAAEAESLEECQAALEIAREIARLAGIPFQEPPKEAAA